MKSGCATYAVLSGGGVSGGIVPCPAALVVLLSAVAMGRIGLGLLLIVGFSVGLAAVLIAIGLLVVHARRLVARLGGTAADGALVRRWLPLTSAAVITASGVVITVQALESGGLVNLGTAFSPGGRVRYGQDVMYVQVRQPNGTVHNHTVRGGEIWMAPVLPGIACDVTVKLRRGLSISGKSRIKTRVTAGAAGIIFDGRGRPLVMPRPRDRAARYMQWQLAMTGRSKSAAVSRG